MTDHETVGGPKTYRLEDLIDIEHFQNLQDRLNEIYSFPSAIIDNEGNVLTATAWQDVCVEFHRKNEDARRICIESDRYIADHIEEADPSLTYRCPHGLVDNATPIIIDGIHYGNFFTGQFFLEKPDLDFYRARAKKYGFDEEAYLRAVEKVPIWTRQQLDSYLHFIRGLIAVISESGLKRLKEIENREQIERSEKRYRSILKASLDGFWVTDANGKILEVNQAYCDMSGFLEEELLSKHISDIEATETSDKVAEHMKRVMAEGSDRFETKHRRKDGTLFDVEVSVQFREEEAGLCVCFVRDVTERKTVEARLSQSQKLESIGTLAGGIAHDFNNILCPIIGLSEMLVEDLEPGSLNRENALEILSAGKRGSDLVQQILAFSRQTESKVIPVAIQRVLQEVVKLCRATIPTSIEIVQDIQSDSGMVEADPIQIHQIAMNLVTNAYHAVLAEGGRITVGLKERSLDQGELPGRKLRPGRYAVMSISDNGCGIEEGDLGQIFEPYFTTKEKGKGTGLGLAVVHGIVEKHHGEITVTSKVGEGTTFEVYLPLKASRPSQRSGHEETPLPTGTEHVLLVDDELSVLRMEEQLLERLGYQVTSRSDSLAALETFQDDPRAFDLILSDMNMPNMCGDSLARHVIAIRPDVPIVICTGFSERIDRQRAKTLGITDFIMKPVRLSTLALTIRSILDRKS